MHSYPDTVYCGCNWLAPSHGCSLIQSALLLDTGQPWAFRRATPESARAFKQQHALWNCFSNHAVSAPLFTVSSPLAKPGKLLPLVSLSQETKSGTNVQMITELGKLSLCRLLPLVPSLCAAPYQLVSIYVAAAEALAVPMASLWTVLFVILVEMDCLHAGPFEWTFFGGICFVFLFFFLRLQSITRNLIMHTLFLWLFSYSGTLLSTSPFLFSSKKKHSPTQKHPYFLIRPPA